MKYFEFILTLPFRIIIAIVGFIVWELFSNGNWKWRKRMGTCPVGSLQEQIRWGAHQKKGLEYEHKKEKDDLHSIYKQEIKKKDREISRLRSELDKKR